MSDPGRRGVVAPIVKFADGSWDWAVPQLAIDAWDGITAPYDAMTGKLDPMSPEATRRVLSAAGFAMGGPAVGAVERVAAGEAQPVLRTMFAKGPMEYDPPKYPRRPFKADYPGEVPSDAAGKLTADIDGRPLTARHVAGRRVVQGPDEPLTARDMAAVAEGGTGTGIEAVERGRLGGASGGVRVDEAGRPLRLFLADDLHSSDVPRVLAHETGHVIDQLAGNIPTTGLERELAQVYHSQITGERWSASPVTPQSVGYADDAAPREYMVEALRSYMQDPNSLKYAAPETAARIREHVNANPNLNRLIQFNQGGLPGAAIGAAAGGEPAFGDRSMPSSGFPPLPPGFVLVPETAQQTTMPPLPPGFVMADPAPARVPAPMPDAFPQGEIRVPMGAEGITGSDAAGVDRSGVTGIGGAAQVGAGQRAQNSMSPDDVVRMLANGATFGLADKFAGGMDAMTGQADGYDAGVTAQRARTADVRADHPYLAGGAELAGGLAGGAGLMRQGVTLAGRVGSGLLPRIAGYGAEGAAYGAAHGAGNTYSDEVGDYTGNAWDGAKVGGMVGVGLPLAGSALGALVRGGQTVAGPTIEGAGRSASALLRGAAQADEAGLRNLAQMGDEAMLVDAGPSMLGLGQGAGTGTGQGRSQLVNALRERDAGTGQRLASTLDAQLGPAPIPSQVRAGLDDSKRQIGELYGRPFSEADLVDTRDLAGSLDEVALRLRGPAQAAVRKVRGYLDKVREEGDPAGVQLDTAPETLFQTRQAIDGLLTGEADPKVIRQLSMARQSVDELLQHSVPRIKEVDGRFAEVARQDEALTRGGQVFDTGKTAIRPAELAGDIQQSALPQGEFVGPSGVPHRMRQGARAEVDRLVGTNINDLNTLERKLGTGDDWNNAKFATLFGEAPRNAVMEALTTNRKFRQSYQDIVQNSQTAQRQAAQKAMDGEIEIPLDTTLAGTAAAGGRAVWRALMGLSKEATKDEVGKLLSAKGPDAQRIMKELLARDAATKRDAAIARALIANPANAAAAGQYGGRPASR